MSTLIPNISDALTVHDAAHREQNPEVHEVALKMLALCDQVHICTDGLDEPRENEWGKLPGAFCLDTEAAALVGDCLVSGSVLPASLPGQKMQDQSFQYKARVPAYELWLVRKSERGEVKPECAFEAGKHVPVGFPRKHGAYKFPVVCQRVPEEYQMLQVHKDGDRVWVFDKSGQQPRGMADLIDTFVSMDHPETAIFETVVADGKVQLFDVLMLDGIDCTVLPYSERDKLIADVVGQNERLPDGIEPAECWKIKSEDDLPNLERGAWIVRYEHEVLGDLMRPFWFTLHAGAIKPGTVLPWVKPSEKAADSSGMIYVKDTGLPSLQIHKQRGSVSVFIGDGGRNRVASLPQIEQWAKFLPEDFIIEAKWFCRDAGMPVSVERVQNPKQDLSACDVAVHPYDLVLWGEETVAERPMYERVDLLEQIVGQYMDGVTLAVCEDASAGDWCFVADSERPLDGTNRHCQTV